jgi:hypothetical protein
LPAQNSQKQEDMEKEEVTSLGQLFFAEKTTPFRLVEAKWGPATSS